MRSERNARRATAPAPAPPPSRPPRWAGPVCERQSRTRARTPESARIGSALSAACAPHRARARPRQPMAKIQAAQMASAIHLDLLAQLEYLPVNQHRQRRVFINFERLDCQLAALAVIEFQRQCIAFDAIRSVRIVRAWIGILQSDIARDNERAVRLKFQT